MADQPRWWIDDSGTLRGTDFYYGLTEQDVEPASLAPVPCVWVDGHG
jgi:hypothetical protein